MFCFSAEFLIRHHVFYSHTHTQCLNVFEKQLWRPLKLLIYFFFTHFCESLYAVVDCSLKKFLVVKMLTETAGRSAVAICVLYFENCLVGHIKYLGGRRWPTGRMLGIPALHYCLYPTIPKGNGRNNSGLYCVMWPARLLGLAGPLG